MERAALSLAASVVSPISAKLGNRASSYFGGDVTEEELQHLRNIILPKIQTTLDLARAIRVDRLKPWLTTLQAAAYEAEDVIDMYEYKRLKADAEVSSFPDPLKKLKKKAKSFVAPLSLKTELKKSMEKLRRSAEEADKLIHLCGAISQTPLVQDAMQQQRVPTVSSTSSPVFGRDEDRKSLVKTLMSATNELSGSERRILVLAIYGIGGAGKTTLAQYVYNDSRVVNHFDTRMWVHVSRKFDARKVTSEIIESITKQGECSNINSLDVLQMKLRDLLKLKKFLLVLDDVWCHDSTQWDRLFIPLNEVGDTESRILVTTRTQEVASRLGIEKVVALKDLEAEDCSSIFKYYSFGDANKVIHDPELATVAEQIMMKLKKSPLSARMVGCLLRGKTNVADWKQILKKDEMLSDTLNTLYLSFDSLAPHLQRCFAYCSLYPKGYHFYQRVEDDLVRVWIAQGFVEAPYSINMTIEDKGMQYFNELVSYSFFQMEGGSYVIHDLLHDLAEEVSKDHHFRIEDDTLHIPATIMHLSIYSKRDLFLHIRPHMLKLVNLRTFMIHGISNADYNGIVDSRNKIFEKFKRLRVLHLGFNGLSGLHKLTSQLKHLRYLHVHKVDYLPESLGRLYHLNFLNIRWVSSVSKIPANLNNLINLRFLVVEHEIISKIPSFGKLTSLQEIKIYNVSRKKGHGIEQLKYLQHIRGSLSIYNLENLQDKAEASESSLTEKKLLDELTLTWKYSSERDGRIDEEVIDGLEPPPSLKVLKIDGYQGVELPKWLLNDARFSHQHSSCLSELSIDNCPELKQVPYLPGTLKRFEITRCENLFEASSLPLNLRAVRVRHCYKLMQLSPYPPNLEEIYICGCPGVVTLLSGILLFEDGDEDPNQQQQGKDDQQQFPLRILDIESCSISGKKRLFSSNPNRILASLFQLTLRSLPWLASLLLVDHNLTSLKYVSITDCENLELFRSSLASASSLHHLHISDCPGLTMQHLQSWTDGSFLLPSSLKELEFRNCADPEMNLLERCLRGLTSLGVLEIVGYSRARSLPDLPNPGAMEYLRVSDCPELASMWNLLDFSSLNELYVQGCPKLVIEGGGEQLTPSLEKITIDNLSLLAALLHWGRGLKNSLSSLRIEGCTEAIAFTKEQEELFQHLTSLTRLYIRFCPGLTSLPVNLEKLCSLREMFIHDCPKIESLPNLPTSLKRLDIAECHPHLHASYGKNGPLHHKVRHIPHLYIRRYP